MKKAGQSEWIVRLFMPVTARRRAACVSVCKKEAEI